MNAAEVVALVSAIGIPTIFTTFCAAIVGRRKKENTLILRGILISGDLARATAVAYKEGHPNGIMEEALAAHAEYRLELQDFLCGAGSK